MKIKRFKRILKHKSLVITAAAVVVIAGAGASYALVKQYTPVQNAAPTPSVEVSASPSPSPVPEVEETPTPTTSVSPSPTQTSEPAIISKDDLFTIFYTRAINSDAPNKHPITHLGLYNYIYRTYEKNPAKFVVGTENEIFAKCKTQFVSYDLNNPSVVASLPQATCNL